MITVDGFSGSIICDVIFAQAQLFLAIFFQTDRIICCLVTLLKHIIVKSYQCIYFCPCMYWIAYIIIFIYLLKILLNLMSNFLFVLNKSSLFARNILYWWWEVTDSTTAPFFGKDSGLFQGNGLWSCHNLSSERSFCNFCCFILLRVLVNFFICKVSF